MKLLNSGMGFTLLYLLSGLVQGGNYALELDINTGYNNNVFLESDDVIANEVSQRSSQSDMQTQMALTANVEFWDQPNSDAAFMLDYFKERLNDNELETTVTTFSVPMHYYQGDYRYGVTLTRQNYNLSDVDVLNYLIAKVDAAKKMGDDKMYLSYSVTDKTPQDESYSDYEGSSYEASVKYRINEAMNNWTLQGSVFSNDYLGDGLTNAGGYLKAVYHINQGRHTMAAGIKAKRTLYDLNTLTNDERSDRQLSFNYNHEYFLNSFMQLYFDASYIRNQSNIEYTDENYNYNQWIHTLGTRFVF